MQTRFFCTISRCVVLALLQLCKWALTWYFRYESGHLFVTLSRQLCLSRNNSKMIIFQVSHSSLCRSIASFIFHFVKFMSCKSSNDSTLVHRTGCLSNNYDDLCRLLSQPGRSEFYVIPFNPLHTRMSHDTPSTPVFKKNMWHTIKDHSVLSRGWELIKFKLFSSRIIQSSGEEWAHSAGNCYTTNQNDVIILFSLSLSMSFSAAISQGIFPCSSQQTSENILRMFAYLWFEMATLASSRGRRRMDSDFTNFISLLDTFNHHGRTGGEEKREKPTKEVEGDVTC